MTSDDRRRLAEWMGWKIQKAWWNNYPPAYYEGESFRMWEDKWHPDTDTDIAQAMMLLEKIRRQGYYYNAWDTDTYHHFRLTNIYGYDGQMYTGHGKTPEAAICEAVLKMIQEGGD